MNTSEARQCHGKARHRSRSGADKAIAVHGRIHGDLTLEAYRCGHCGFWHVGHPPKRQQKRLRFSRLLALIARANRKDDQ